MRCHEKIPGSFWHSAKILDFPFHSKSQVIQSFALRAASQVLRIKRRLDLRECVKTFYRVRPRLLEVGTLAA
jgi:hypothetical protein